MENNSVNNYENLKVRTETTLEAVSLSMAFFCFLLGIVGLLFFLFGKSHGIVLFLIGSIGFLLGLSFKICLFENCVFDTNTGFVWFEYSYLFWHDKTPVAEIAEIETVFVEGMQESGRFADFWTYRISILLKSGKILPIGRNSFDNLKAQNDQAKRIAKNIGASFFPARKEKAVLFNPESSPIRLEYIEWPKAKKAEEYVKGFVLAAGLIALILGTIVSLTIFFSQN